MLSDRTKAVFENTLQDIRNSGLFKSERVIQSPQGAVISVSNTPVLNFCANNYLGLANHPTLVSEAQNGLQAFGYGLSSVRFICGTQTLHKSLENTVARFLGMDDVILYSSCFDANAGLFETLLGPEDAIFSDELNHASIIDGVRLCKAKRFRYKNNNMTDLETQLKTANDARIKLIVTDGVFSMDGVYANLPGICDLASAHDALVMVDDSHATGFVGKTGRGTPEHWNVQGRIDILTSTFGKALGGASGGFTAGHQTIVSLLRQRSRPYLFSNSVAPAIVATTHKALELIEKANDLRETLHRNTIRLRTELSDLGFSIIPGVHPIIPVMIFDAKKAKEMADALLEEGVYVIAFSYPVVPKGKARIRIQVSAAHTQDHLGKTISAFAKVGHQLGVLKK